MPRPVSLHSYSFIEYLALEEASNTKHEYWNGEIYAMGGGSPAHAALAVAIGAALLQQLRGGTCRVYSSDLRIRVLGSGLATYPDVSVVCGDPETDPESSSTMTNPKLIVEVLSDSTAKYDRGEKLEQYKTVPSIDAILIVSQTTRTIEIHRRTNTEWKYEQVTGGQSIELPTIGSTLSVDAIYDDAGIQAG